MTITSGLLDEASRQLPAQKQLNALERTHRAIVMPAAEKELLAAAVQQARQKGMLWPLRSVSSNGSHAADAAARLAAASGAALPDVGAPTIPSPPSRPCRSRHALLCVLQLTCIANINYFMHETLVRFARRVRSPGFRR